MLEEPLDFSPVIDTDYSLYVILNLCHLTFYH